MAMCTIAAIFALILAGPSDRKTLAGRLDLAKLVILLSTTLLILLDNQ